jgi:hypothetical protein
VTGTAPIGLFTYSRPAHAAHVVKSLLRNREAADSELFVFSDAAKTPDDAASVAAVRKLIASVQGFRRIELIERDRNLGLAGSIVEGVTRLCASHGRAIIVEDDIVVSPFFLRYMNEALERYSDDDRVISIGGYMYPLAEPLPETFFLRMPDCWGWATWKRGWDHYEPDGAALLAEIRNRRLTRRFDLEGSYRYTRMLENQIAGRNDSWAVRWYAKAFLLGRLSLYPGRSVTRNIGNDGSGVHSGVTSVYDSRVADSPIELGDVPVEEHQGARAHIASFHRRTGSRWRSWLSAWTSPAPR